MMNPSILSVLILWWPQQTTPESMESIAGMLRSDRIEDRAGACARLRALGFRAKEAILELEADPDLEVRLRAQELLRSLILLERIPRRILDAFPKLAKRLAWDEEAVGDVLAALGEKADVLWWDEGCFYQSFAEGATLLPYFPDLIEKADLEAAAMAAFRESASGEEKRLLCQWASSLELTATIPEITLLVGDRDPTVRIQAIQAVCDLKAIEALGEVVRSLDDPEPRVVDAARTTLQWIGVDEAADLLVAFLAEQPGPFGTVEALLLLGRSESRGALPAVRSCLKSGEAWVRKVAAETMAGLARENSFPDLLDLVRDPDEVVRQTVLSLILKFGLPGTEKAVLEGLEDPSVRVRQEALFGLARIGKKDAVSSILKLLDDPLVRQTALHALTALDAKEALPEIRKHAKDPDPYVRRQAALALEKLQ